jgi:hypothetical protein
VGLNILGIVRIDKSTGIILVATRGIFGLVSLGAESVILVLNDASNEVLASLAD